MVAPTMSVPTKVLPGLGTGEAAGGTASPEAWGLAQGILAQTVVGAVL